MIIGSFYSDTIVRSPAYRSPDLNRDPALVEPETLRRLNAVIMDAHAQGSILALFEGFRSQTRQEALYRQGRTQLRIVGCHGYGLAGDLVKLVPATRAARAVHAAQRAVGALGRAAGMVGGYPPEHGAIHPRQPALMWSWAGDYTFLGPLMKKHGLLWGGTWRMRDMVHGQRVRVEDQPRVFAGAWYPDVSYDPTA